MLFNYCTYSNYALKFYALINLSIAGASIINRFSFSIWRFYYIFDNAVSHTSWLNTDFIIFYKIFPRQWIYWFVYYIIDKVPKAISHMDFTKLHHKILPSIVIISQKQQKNVLIKILVRSTPFSDKFCDIWVSVVWMF